MPDMPYSKTGAAQAPGATPGAEVAGGRILLTGATGYVGARLLRALEERGDHVRCLVRRRERLRDRVAPGTEIREGDVADGDSLRAALDGVGTAYYLVHSLGGDGDFERKDRRLAQNFADAARAAGVHRIVYLGGLGRGPDLSPHLRSRQEVGRILRRSGVPTIEFRASVIIGSGSLSFEMVRALVERLPLMVAPRWVRTAAQPIAIDDVIEYLLAALDLRVRASAVFEIGGADRVSYGAIMKEYARQRGLDRVLIPVPVLTPWLSSLWLKLVTPLHAGTGRELIEGVRNPTVVVDPRASRVFSIRPRALREAIAEALAAEDSLFEGMRWARVGTGAGSVDRGEASPGARRVDSRQIEVPVAPDLAFAPIGRIGGRTGWYYANWIWRVRGLIDRWVGGVGLRRGAREVGAVARGDTIDFWRVDRVEPGRRLSLRAEMKLPGRAWLHFEVDPSGSGSRITQTAVFDPVGLGGRLYWYALRPVHRLVFDGMLRAIGREAVTGS